MVGSNRQTVQKIIMKIPIPVVDSLNIPYCRYCGQRILSRHNTSSLLKMYIGDDTTYREYYHDDCITLFPDSSKEVPKGCIRFECKIIQVHKFHVKVKIQNREFLVQKGTIGILKGKCLYYNNMIQVDIPKFIVDVLKLEYL